MDFNLNYNLCETYPIILMPKSNHTHVVQLHDDKALTIPNINTLIKHSKK